MATQADSADLVRPPRRDGLASIGVALGTFLGLWLVTSIVATVIVITAHSSCWVDGGQWWTREPCGTGPMTSDPHLFLTGGPASAVVTGVVLGFVPAAFIVAFFALLSRHTR